MGQTKLSTKMTTITNITILSNTELEFVANNRAYLLEVTQNELDATYGINDTYSECPFTGRGHYDTEPEMGLVSWRLLPITTEAALEVINANENSWYDITECSDLGATLLKKQARRNLLSYIVTTANKMRATLKSMSLAMHVAWTRAKILAAGVVNFVKVGDVDTEEEIPLHTRRVTSLESAGYIPTGSSKGEYKDILKFIDLDKFEAWIESGMTQIEAAKRSVISMHVWQVV